MDFIFLKLNVLLLTNGDKFLNRKLKIERIISSEINPYFFSVKDVSSEHRGHQSFKEGVESHFDIVIVADIFEDMSKIERHRLINKMLKEEFLLDLHSVTLKVYSIEEFRKTK